MPRSTARGEKGSNRPCNSGKCSPRYEPGRPQRSRVSVPGHSAGETCSNPRHGTDARGTVAGIPGRFQQLFPADSAVGPASSALGPAGAHPRSAHSAHAPAGADTAPAGALPRATTTPRNVAHATSSSRRDLPVCLRWWGPGPDPSAPRRLAGGPVHPPASARRAPSPRRAPTVRSAGAPPAPSAQHPARHARTAQRQHPAPPHTRTTRRNTAHEPGRPEVRRILRG